MKVIDIVGMRRWFFIGSAVLTGMSLVLLAVFQLRPGIEFTSGTTMLVRFEQGVSQDELRQAFADLGHAEARIQSTGQNEYLIRTSQLEVPEGSFTEVEPEAAGADFIGPEPLPELGAVVIGAEGASGEVELRQPPTTDTCTLGEPVGSVDAGTEATVTEVVESCPDGTIYRVLAGDVYGYVAEADTHGFQPAAGAPGGVTPNAGERTVVEQRLLDEFGAFEVREFASVSPVVSRAAVLNAAVAVVVASLFIMAYIAFAFSSLPRPFRYAVCAVVALLHDVIIVLGAFALFGVLFGTEINLMFVTALLTVIGFSVHDTIVVFDRLRENIRQAPQAPLHENVNSALLQTVARSMNTSITLLLTAAAMLALGGVTIRDFLLVIVVGVSFGTYSSIAIAPLLVVAWEDGEFDRLLRRRPRPTPEAAS